MLLFGAGTSCGWQHTSKHAGTRSFLLCVFEWHVWYSKIFLIYVVARNIGGCGYVCFYGTKYGRKASRLYERKGSQPYERKGKVSKEIVTTKSTGANLGCCYRTAYVETRALLLLCIFIPPLLGSNFHSYFANSLVYLIMRNHSYPSKGVLRFHIYILVTYLRCISYPMSVLTNIIPYCNGRVWVIKTGLIIFRQWTNKSGII